MAGILGITNSALNAFQQGLAVTGNNIANIHTSGYSRQSIHFNASPSHRYAGSFIGSGVTVTGIHRNSDSFANEQVRNTQSIKSQYDIFYQQARQLDALLSQDGNSVSARMQDFFNALSQLNDAPDSLAGRNVVLTQSRVMVEQFNTIQNQINEYQHTNGQQLQEAVHSLNQLTQNLVEVNEHISAAGRAPELMDQRDELIRQISELTDVTVLEEENGVVNLAVGKGEMLVIGSERHELAVDNTNPAQNGTHIVLNNGASAIDITENFHTGMIGGLLDFENNILTQSSQLLGQMAIGMAMAFNDQHRLGMDMNDQLGKDIFTDFNTNTLQQARSTPWSANTGTGILSVAIEDIGQTKLSDYELMVTDSGSNEVRVLRKSDGTSYTLNWTDTPPTPPAGAISLDGMRIQVDDIGNLANNDRYTLSPTRGAAENLQMLIRDPRELAFASPVRTQALMSNSGTGNVRLGQVLNTSDVMKEYRVEFISDTQFNLVNVTDGISTGPMAFTPNQDNTVRIPDSLNPSYSIVLSGLPKAGDAFTATYNQGGIGDNSNGLLLNSIQNTAIFENDTENLFDRHSLLVAGVGSKTHQAQLRSESANILYQQAVDFRESKSGVNLDEEAANLLRFQQAYQAAGQLLSVANDMIAVLFSAMR